MVRCYSCELDWPDGTTTCRKCAFPLDASATDSRSRAVPLPDGTKLKNGRYHIIRELGQGGFGITYEAEDTVNRSRVAVKESFSNGGTQETTCTRRGLEVVPPPGKEVEFAKIRADLLKEAKIVEGICAKGSGNPDTIVDVFDAFEANGTSYLVMEFIKGVSLKEVVGDRGPLPEPEAIRILEAMCDALDYLHSKCIVHRDVKPANIMQRRTGAVVLVDFGSARRFDSGQQQQHTQLVTDGYSAPEQYERSLMAGPWQDVYALAATGFALLTGTDPPTKDHRNDGVALPPFPAGISTQVQRAIRWGLVLDQDLRPQTAGQFKLALQGKLRPSPFADRIRRKQQEIADIEQGRGAPPCADQKEIEQINTRLEHLDRAGQVGVGQCPACGRAMTKFPPGDNRCFACQKGQLKPVDLKLQAKCPSCGREALSKTKEVGLTCPVCRLGEMLEVQRWRGNDEVIIARCDSRECGAQMEIRNREGRIISEGQRPMEEFDCNYQPIPGWRLKSGVVDKWGCSSCGAVIARGDDPTYRVISCPSDALGRKDRLLNRPLEERVLACIAQGLPEDTGDERCGNCGLELVRQDGHEIIHKCGPSAPDWLRRHLGTQVSRPEMHRQAIGKRSPNAGFVCVGCGLELDGDSEQAMRIVSAGRQSVATMPGNVGAKMSWVDWTRLFRSLPSVAEERSLRTRLTELEDKRTQHLAQWKHKEKARLQKELDRLLSESSTFEEGLST